MPSVSGDEHDIGSEDVVGVEEDSSAGVMVNAGRPAVAAAVAVTAPFQGPMEELSAFKGDSAELGAVFDRCLLWNNDSACV